MNQVIGKISIIENHFSLRFQNNIRWQLVYLIKLESNGFGVAEMELLNEQPVEGKQRSFLERFKAKLLNSNFKIYHHSVLHRYNTSEIFNLFFHSHSFYFSFRDITQKTYGSPTGNNGSDSDFEFQIAEILTFYAVIKFIFQKFEWPVRMFVDEIYIQSKDYLKKLQDDLEYILNGSYSVTWDNSKQIGNFKNRIEFPSFFKNGTEKLVKKINKEISNEEVKNWLELLVQPLQNKKSIIASISEIHAEFEKVDEDRDFKEYLKSNGQDEKIWIDLWKDFKHLVNKVNGAKGHYSAGTLSVSDINITVCTLGYILYKLYEKYKNKENQIVKKAKS